MAANEDPSFGGIGSADAISSAASAIANIKSDMASIEASAKNTASELRKAGRVRISSPSAPAPSAQANGNTGYSKDQGMSLGAITQAVGGAGVMVAGGFAAAGSMAGLASGAPSPLTGALAVGGFRDLRVTGEQGLAYERARFNFALGTGGQFDQFQAGLERSMNSFNVQDREVYAQQYGQLSQLYGLQAGGQTVGSRVFGSLMTSMQYAGMDQASAVQTYNQLYGAPSYYNLQAMGVQTRDVEGNTLATYQIANQVYDFIGGGRDVSSEELQREMRPGAGLRVSLEQAVGVEGANLILTDLQRRVEGGGNPLTEEAGELLGTEDTQGMEARAALERENVELLGEYANDATLGVKLMTDEITKAVDWLGNLEGPLRDVAGGATAAGAALDTFATDMPKASNTVQSAFSGLATFAGSLLGSYLGGSGGGAVARGAGALAKRAAPWLGRAAAAAGGVPALLGGTALTAAAATFIGIPALVQRYDTGAEERVQRLTTTAQQSQVQAEERKQEASTSGNDLEEFIADTGQGTTGVPQYSKGEWFVESDKTAKIHYGEMVLPNRIAQAVRQELDTGQFSDETKRHDLLIGAITAPPLSKPERQPVQVNINLTLQRTTEQEAMRFATRVKSILDDDDELMAAGAGRF